MQVYTSEIPQLMMCQQHLKIIEGCHIKDFELIKSLQTLDKHAQVDGVGERDGHAGFGGLFPRGWMR